MEQNVTIQHHEALVEQSSCRPERIETVGFRKTGILDVRRRAGPQAAGPGRPGSRRRRRCRRCRPARASRICRSSSVRPPAFDETLRLVAGRAVEPGSFACRENDALHASMSPARGRVCAPSVPRSWRCTAAGRGARRPRRTARDTAHPRPPPQPRRTMRRPACSRRDTNSSAADDQRRPARRPDRLTERPERSGDRTRRQAIGKRMKIDEKATGMSVPMATPSRPNGPISAALSARLTRPVPIFTIATRRMWPEPLSSVVLVALPTRSATANARIWMTGAAAMTSGLPDPGPDQRLGEDDEHERDRQTVASDSRVPFEQDPLQPADPLRRVRVDDDGEEHGVSLVGQPLRAGDDAVRDRPDRDRRRRRGRRR